MGGMCFGKSLPLPGIEDLDVKKRLSVEQFVTIPRQAEVGTLVARSVVIWFKVLGPKSASLCLILFIVFNLWINREGASSCIARSGASLAELRSAIGYQCLFRRRHETEFVEPLDRESSVHIGIGRLIGDGSGILQNLGLAVFVSGLSPYLPQDSQKQPCLPDQCASLRGSDEYQLAGEQRRFPLYLEILAGVFLCGLISWGDAMWTQASEASVDHVFEIATIRPVNPNDVE
jgi:hypothetical protein